MDMLRGAVSMDEYKTIIHEIEKTMDDEKDNHCERSYSSLTEARNDIYSLYTESLREEAGLVITNNINSLKIERGQVKTKMSDIEYNTNLANSRKGQRDNLLKEIEQVRKDLIQQTQETGDLETTGNVDQDNFRTATIARVHQHLEQIILPTAKEGVREDQNEAAKYNT